MRYFIYCLQGIIWSEKRRKDLLRNAGIPEQLVGNGFWNTHRNRDDCESNVDSLLSLRMDCGGEMEWRMEWKEDRGRRGAMIGSEVDSSVFEFVMWI